MYCFLVNHAIHGRYVNNDFITKQIKGILKKLHHWFYFSFSTSTSFFIFLIEKSANVDIVTIKNGNTLLIQKN